MEVNLSHYTLPAKKKTKTYLINSNCKSHVKILFCGKIFFLIQLFIW